MPNRVAAVTQRLPPRVRVVTVTVVGGAVLVAGGAMLVLPGPGIPVVILGLSLLALEYAWARRTLDRAKAHSNRAITVLARSTRRGRVSPQLRTREEYDHAQKAKYSTNDSSHRASETDVGWSRADPAAD